MPLLLEHERPLWTAGRTRVAGIDEAGRGCLAGPVVAAAVILPPDDALDGLRDLDDSKRLSKAQREALVPMIQEAALGIGVGLCSPEEIDRLNILHAALEAMRRAARALDPAPDHLLIDGNRAFAPSPWPLDTLVKGDQRSTSIAAASVVAKVTRDRIMADLGEAYPAFGWAQNAGYPTRAHYAALETHGPTPYHRRSFRLTTARTAE